MGNSDIIDLIAKGSRIVGIILIILSIGGAISWFFNASLWTETKEIEVTTEDQLPVNQEWGELAKGKYKIDISIRFKPYIRVLGDKSSYLVVPQGLNLANFSVNVNNTSLTSWGWSDWVNEGKDSINFRLNSSENITLNFFFILEEFDKEFEAQWYITITEVDEIKKWTTMLILNIWRYLIVGGILFGVGIFLPDFIENAF